ncbi:alpha/beta hydrolase [Pseudobutyrivibrio xylanivorans]|uniref:Alpha/beta hydrolase family protein n=1 Tax=Pseudobutyrivibrio xylanivorans DSM 14809 TaxID=1123012 RepID=A0A1M6DCX2_PSEXY|nr:alpha/beta hydrolase [Pseudobutyrivibrio xylanivorans]SHI71049.1 Alpha/beta hydrolase family protein [Pseudobutyrivibrio xylanivorans DSM 14809]
MKKRFSFAKLRKIIVVILIWIVFIVKATLVFQTAYEASDRALEYIDNPADGVTVIDKIKLLEFTPENPEIGFIFYPGALVEPDAYAPLMEQLAEHGIKCIIVRMPQYMALLDANGARGIREMYPEIKHWYLGGHSLGGAMASMYGNIHSDEFDGLIFLAAYATDDLTDDDIKVLLVRGDQDKVLNMDRYNECLKNLPSDYQECVIKGGCHAYFGDYGPQQGDGKPSITVEEQTAITVEKLVEFME